MAAPEQVISRLVSSPCCIPGLGLEEILRAYAGIGFRKFEVFTSWAGAAFDIDADAAGYVELGRACGMDFTSFHLPPIRGDDRDATLARAVKAAGLAKAVGAGVVLYKADSRETYAAAAADFLDAIDGLGVTPVVQNHFGTPVSTLEDLREVLDGIGDDRMKGLLEVGQFHSAGVPWLEGYDLLAGRMALVHIKDQVGRESVAFGEGEIDLPGLFERLAADGYSGDVVVEMEVGEREKGPTLELLERAIEYVRANWPHGGASQ